MQAGTVSQVHQRFYCAPWTKPAYYCFAVALAKPPRVNSGATDAGFGRQLRDAMNDPGYAAVLWWSVTSILLMNGSPIHRVVATT
jgi:hypothetical protein